MTLDAVKEFFFTVDRILPSSTLVVFCGAMVFQAFFLLKRHAIPLDIDWLGKTSFAARQWHQAFLVVYELSKKVDARILFTLCDRFASSIIRSSERHQAGVVEAGPKRWGTLPNQNSRTLIWPLFCVQICLKSIVNYLCVLWLIYNHLIEENI